MKRLALFLLLPALGFARCEDTCNLSYCIPEEHPLLAEGRCDFLDIVNEPRTLRYQDREYCPIGAWGFKYDIDEENWFPIYDKQMSCAMLEHICPWAKIEPEIIGD